MYQYSFEYLDSLTPTKNLTGVAEFVLYLRDSFGHVRDEEILVEERMVLP